MHYLSCRLISALPRLEQLRKAIRLLGVSKDPGALIVQEGVLSSVLITDMNAVDLVGCITSSTETESSSHNLRVN